MHARNFMLLGIVIVVAFSVVLFVALRGNGNPPPDTTISLSDLSPREYAPAYQSDTSRLRFAVAAVLSPQPTLENYEALAEYLGEHFSRPVEIVQGKSYAEINALVRSGDVTLALVCSGAYIAGRSDFGMEPLVVPVVNGETTYRSYLIVPHDSDLRSWEDLRGKTFAFTDPLSNTGRLVPIYVLSQIDETPESFFRDFIFTYSHDKSVEAVAHRLVDGASVDSLVYDFMVEREPLVASRTKVIWKSPPYGINPVVVHPEIEPELRQQLETTLLSMSTDPEGKRVLEQLGIDAFAPPKSGAYESIEKMIRATASR